MPNDDDYPLPNIASEEKPEDIIPAAQAELARELQKWGPGVYAALEGEPDPPAEPSPPPDPLAHLDPAQRGNAQRLAAAGIRPRPQGFQPGRNEAQWIPSKFRVGKGWPLP